MDRNLEHKLHRPLVDPSIILQTNESLLFHDIFLEFSYFICSYDFLFKEFLQKVCTYEWNFTKWFHLNYRQIRNKIWKHLLILMFHFGFAFGLCMIFEIPCSNLSRQHIWKKKRRNKILIWAEAKRMRSNRQSQIQYI